MWLRLISTGNSVPSLRAPGQIHAHAHGTVARSDEVSLAVLVVRSAVPLGKQDFEWLCLSTRRAVAEHLFGLGVHQHDLALVVHRHYAL